MWFADGSICPTGSGDWLCSCGRDPVTDRTLTGEDTSKLKTTTTTTTTTTKGHGLKFVNILIRLFFSLSLFHSLF